MMEHVGKKIWVIADGFIHGTSNGPEPDMTSHDTICFLNLSKSDANITMTIYFSDQDPIGPYKVITPSERTLHLRFNDLKDPKEIPADTDFAVLIESDIPIIAQQTRLDSRQSENALFSVMPFSS